MTHRLDGYTAAQFLDDYVERSASDDPDKVRALLLERRTVVECDCDYPACRGWAVVPIDEADR